MPGPWEEGYAAGYAYGFLRGSQGVATVDREVSEIRAGQAQKKRKRKGTPLKGMASALKKANAMARKKDGSFKKGWTQGRVMKTAHRIRRRR